MNVYQIFEKQLPYAFNNNRISIITKKPVDENKLIFVKVTPRAFMDLTYKK